MGAIDDFETHIIGVVQRKAVQVGTAAFVDPYSLPRLVGELSSLLAETGWASVESFIGSYTPPA